MSQTIFDGCVYVVLFRRIATGNYTVPGVAAEGGSVMVTLTPVTV